MAAPPEAGRASAPPGARAGGSPRSMGPWPPLVVAVVCGLLTLVVGAVALGSLRPPVIGDPGAVARWGQVVTRVVHDAALAATVGLLGFAAFLTPETQRTQRRVTACRTAALTGILWLVSGGLSLVLTFAVLAGMPPSAPGFGSQLRAFVWELEPTRVLLLSLLVGVLITCLAAVARTRTGMAWAAVLAVAAVLPLALGGHAAGASGHDNAVSSMALHLMAVVVWLGGLMAIAAFRQELGRDLPVVVRRFSTLAAWSFVVVLASGLVAASVRLGRLSDLGSGYGALLLLKAGVLASLGVLGWRQRSVMIGRLDRDWRDGAAFGRLVLVEIALMGVAAGAAVALSRSAPPVSDVAPAEPDPVLALTGYPSPPPLDIGTYFSQWRWDALWILVGLTAIGAYLYGYRRLRARGDRWPVWRPVAWTAGWLIVLYAMCGAPGIYARVLFSQHMLMHMLVAMIAPILLVPAAPITLALRTIPARRDKTWGVREVVLTVVHSRFMKVLANPVVAALVFFVSMAVFYYSPLFPLALSTHTGHVLMMVHFMASGYLFVWVLIGIDPGPPRWPPLMLLVILFATISFHAFFGVAMTDSRSLLAPDFFRAVHQPWMAHPLADQHTAGAIAWGISEAPTLLLSMLVAVAWMRQDRQETTRKDRQADRDHDAELEAYNAALAQLGRRQQHGGHA